MNNCRALIRFALCDSPPSSSFPRPSSGNLSSGVGLGSPAGSHPFLPGDRTLPASVRSTSSSDVASKAPQIALRTRSLVSHFSVFLFLPVISPGQEKTAHRPPAVTATAHGTARGERDSLWSLSFALCGIWKSSALRRRRRRKRQNNCHDLSSS